MTELSRKTKLEKLFPRVKLDERQLFRLASICNETTTAPVPILRIYIVSADREQTVRGEDPTIFLDERLPRKISKVSILAGDFSDPVFAHISLEASRLSPYLSVEGSDPKAVHALFHELTRELEAAQIGNERLINAFDLAIAAQLLLVIVALVMVCAFAAVNILKNNPASSWQFWVLFIALAGASFVILVIINRLVAHASRFSSTAFPEVEFAGHLADPGSETRSRFSWTLAIIVIPIFVALFVWIVTIAIAAIATPPLSR